MVQKILQSNLRIPEYLIFAIAFFTRFFRLGTPSGYIFDEVYYAFTAKEMLHGNAAAWEWWNTPPEGVAYEWTHPYLGKEFIVLGMKLFGENAFGWRFFSAFFGTGIIILIYFIALKLFKNRLIALLAAFIATMDGLLLVMSRIAMQDICFTFFSLLALLCFLYNRKLLTGIALGLAVATKWTGVYGIGFIGILSIIRLLVILRRNYNTSDTNDKKALKHYDVTSVFILPLVFIVQLLKGLWKKETLVWVVTTPIFFVIIPTIVYLASYTPLFLMKHTIPGVEGNNNWDVFWGLQKQMWWYHTGLKATHSYESRWWTWILDLRSVWLHVDYKDKTIANIYALGNPLVFWFGFVSIIFLVWEYIRTRSAHILVVITGYFSFFLPWAVSPRIMFLYHYTPAVPFLAIASGYMLYKFLEDSTTFTRLKNLGLFTYQVTSTIMAGPTPEVTYDEISTLQSKNRIGPIFVTVYLVLLAILFVYFFPLWTGIQVPKAFSETYFIIKSWK